MPFVLTLDYTSEMPPYIFDLYGHGKLDLRFVHDRVEK